MRVLSYKSFILVLIFWSLGTSGSLQASSDSKKTEPNIIVFLTDDQGWGSTSLQCDKKIKDSKSDYMNTPNLEKLAARGVCFSNGYAPHPNCSPSRLSILTGKSPAQLKMTDIIGRNSGSHYKGNILNPPKHINAIPNEEMTIAEWIKKKNSNYRTAHFGKWHLGGGGPKKHGFDGGDGSTSNREGNGKDPEDPKQIFGIVTRGNRWMEEQVKASKPFYLQYSHYATHLKIQSKKSTLEKCEKRKPGKRHTIASFAAMTEDLDEGLGQVMQKVKDLGIDNNTYIIYLADNGSYPLDNPQNTNGPLHGWKATVWEGGIRVPFVVTGPGVKTKQSDTRVVGYDLFPTICEWIGIRDLPSGVEGGSLVQVLTDQKEEVKRPNDFLVFHWPHYQLAKGGQPTTALYEGPYKLIKFWEKNEYKLFNLNSDLQEVKDLSGQHKEVKERMSENMTAYLKNINAGLPKKNNQYKEDKDPGKKYRHVKEQLMNEPYFVISKKRKSKK